MRSFFLWVFLGMVVVAFAGCANGLVGQGATGTVTTKLIVAPGVDETTIDFSITGNGIDPRTGTIDVVSNPVTAEVAGIPVGSGYTITLATADGICTGSATFDVVENQTTTVTVPIQCTTTPPKRGNVLVNGTFLTCPTVSSMVVSPTSVAVGSTIQVNASAKDLGQGTLTYAWTATSDGTFANPGAAKTTYTCASVGSKTLTVTVSNVSCNDTLSVDVTCTQGGGCTNASDCDDSNPCTTDACVASACTHTNIAGCCTDASQCNDSNVCTTDTCTANQCANSQIQGCCTADSQCNDNDPSTTDTCVANACVHTPVTGFCTDASQCNDSNVCTTDTCVANACVHTPIQGCCTADSQCDDNDPSTTDTCVNNQCIHTPITGFCTDASQCDDSNPCTTDTCVANACVHTPIQGCCTSDGQCNDSNVCTTDTCVANACVNTPVSGCCTDASQCNDNDPNTTDTCVNNQCVHTGTCLDMTGTWITRVTTTGTITAPSPVGTLTGATIDVVQRMYISTVGNNNVAKFEICSLSTVANGSLPFYSDYSPAVLASMSGTGSAPYQCLHVGDTATLPSFTINTGWGGSVTPAGCTCPAAGSVYPPSPPLPTECCGAVDSDGDGVYGITLPTHLFNGALNLWAYAGLTMNITLKNMVVTDPNTNTGTTAFPTTGWIFGSTAGATGTLNVQPASDNVPVTAIKLTGDVPCSTVLTHCSGATCVP